MDDAGALRSLPTALVGPRLHLHFTGGDERFKVQQRIRLLDEAVHATFLQAQFLKEHLLVLVTLQFGDVLLGFRGDNHHFSTFLASQSLHFSRKIVAVFRVRLAHVAHVEHGLCRQQKQVAGAVLLVLRVEGHDTRILALIEHFLVRFQHRRLDFRVLVACRSRFFRLCKATFDGFKVFQLQFGVDDFLVANRVNRTIDVRDVVVLETAQHVDNRVGFADVSEEFVAQSLALRRTFHETRNIDDFAGRRHDSPRMHQLRQLRQSLVGHGDDADIRLNRAKRKIRRLRLCARQAVEQRGLADIRQAHDTTF